MKCDRCDNQATVHLTQVQDGEVKQVHLCEQCAKEAGFDLNSSVSITDVLLGTGGTAKPVQGPASASPTPSKTTGGRPSSCPLCHIRWADFRKSGRLGCPHCYHVFREELGPMLEAMHAGTQHLGKVPAGESQRARLMSELAQLEKKLQEAVHTERYEDAAGLRDAIEGCRHELEQLASAPSS